MTKKAPKGKLSEVALQFNCQAKSFLEDNTSDSDDLFGDLKLSNNIDLCRTKTDFIDGLNILSPSLLLSMDLSDKDITTRKENLKPTFDQTVNSMYNLSSVSKKNINCKSESIRDPKISLSILESSSPGGLNKKNSANQLKGNNKVHKSVTKVNNTPKSLTKSSGNIKSYSLRSQDTLDCLSKKSNVTCSSNSSICPMDLHRPSPLANTSKYSSEIHSRNTCSETCDTQVSIDSTEESTNSDVVSLTSCSKSNIKHINPHCKTNTLKKKELECTRPGTPFPCNGMICSKTITNGSVVASTSNIMESFKMSSLIDQIIPADRSPMTVGLSDHSLIHTPKKSNNEFADTPKRINSSMKQPSLTCLKSNNMFTNKTPVRSAGLSDSAKTSTPLSEIRHMRPTAFMRRSLTPSLRKSLDGRRCTMTDYAHDDLPCTQPISSIILNGVVAYVEIRSGKEYRNAGTKAELESLGAKVENNFTRKVTHCIFHGGKMSTFCRAVDWKIPVVSTLWIEACKAELSVVPVKGYAPHDIAKYKEDLAIYKLRPKITRPVTDSKVRFRQHQTANAIAPRPVGRGGGKPRASIRNVPHETNGMIDALHSVADDIKSASHKFEKILTSPLLQKKDKCDHNGSSNVSRMINSKHNSDNKKKRNKKLIFVSSEDKNNKNKMQEKNQNLNVNLNETNDSTQEIRVSYDSDDLLVYAKKQAAMSRCSAPGRLLTSRKCKKLLSSSQKASDVAGRQDMQTNAKKISRHQNDKNTKKSDTVDNQNELDKTKKQKTRKRKLLLPTQVIYTFDQDSNESNTDVTPPCPYIASPTKRQKTSAAAKSTKAKLLPIAPVWSDLESDDSSRSSRRESSALFVKKDKPNPQKHVPPTIVCTSLHRSDVEVVNSIVSRLGKFSVERAVSERTTHVLTSCPRRTLNLVKGIARGCWILNVKWVYESLEAGKWLPEERFELVDFSPSVKTARVERQAFGPEFGLDLFRGAGLVYVCRSTTPPAPDLAELLRLCGATVVSSARAARIVIGSSRPLSPHGRPPLVIREKWVLDCITRLTFINPQEYALNEN